MSFPTGWTSARLTIDNTKVSGTTNLTNFPVLINNVALGTTGVGTAIWSNSQGQEINTNKFLNDANLQGYWRFQGNGNDETANNYDFTAYGTPSYVAGKFGTCADLESSGTNQYFLVSAPNCNVITSQTWSCWIKPESAGTLDQNLICIRNSGGGNNRAIFILATTARIRWDLDGLSSGRIIVTGKQIGRAHV